MIDDQEGGTTRPGGSEEDPTTEPEAGLEERLERFRARADSSADVSSRAFTAVLALVLALMGLLALLALASRWLEAG